MKYFVVISNWEDFNQHDDILGDNIEGTSFIGISDTLNGAKILWKKYTENVVGFHSKFRFDISIEDTSFKIGNVVEKCIIKEIELNTISCDVLYRNNQNTEL